MLLGLPLWGVGGGCRALAVAQLVWEQDCPSESRAKTGARAGSVTTEAQTKSPFPYNFCTQRRGLQEPLGGGGRLHTPASPEPDSSNSLSTQGKRKTDGATPVSLRNERRPGLQRALGGPRVPGQEEQAEGGLIPGALRGRAGEGTGAPTLRHSKSSSREEGA